MRLRTSIQLSLMMKSFEVGTDPAVHGGVTYLGPSIGFGGHYMVRKVESIEYLA